MFTKINQLDYPNIKMGISGVPISKAGCLTCVIVMGYNYLFDKNSTPVQITPQLTYTQGGYLSWPSIKVLGLMLVSSIAKQATPYSAIANAYANPNQIVALEVNNGAHFVWLTGRYIPVLGFKINDPWRGVATYTGLKGYKITGCRIIGKI